MNDNITLPRSVVEHVMYHLNRGDADAVCWADGVIKPALEQQPTTEESSAVQQPQVEQKPVARVVGTGHLGGHFDWCKPDSQDYLPPGALLYTSPQPPVVEQPHPAEMLGETCIDGGKCHHKCADRCFRRECCAPFSDYSGPWKYEQTQPQVEQEPDAFYEWWHMRPSLTRLQAWLLWKDQAKAEGGAA